MKSVRRLLFFVFCLHRAGIHALAWLRLVLAVSYIHGCRVVELLSDVLCYIYSGRVVLVMARNETKVSQHVEGQRFV